MWSDDRNQIIVEAEWVMARRGEIIASAEAARAEFLLAGMAWLVHAAGRALGLAKAAPSGEADAIYLTDAQARYFDDRTLDQRQAANQEVMAGNRAA